MRFVADLFVFDRLYRIYTVLDETHEGRELGYIISTASNSPPQVHYYPH